MIMRRENIKKVLKKEELSKRINVQILTIAKDSNSLAEPACMVEMREW